MDEFDLGRLTDFDFEKLCKDIFEQLLGVRLELFAPGTDHGIDLRGFRSETGESIIIQCKHWAKSGRNKLIAHYEKDEMHKVRRLQPDRYIVATTAELTVTSKSKLSTILRPYLKSSDDIYGVHEIVAFLRTHPEIVFRHIRLWLSSAAVLSALLNRDVANRTHGLAQDIEESLRVYVPSRSHDEAQRILDEEHACVITGLPGIGKSTLAHVLLAAHAGQGYTIVDASWQLEDVDKMWHEGEKQIFFVDDFLGQTGLDDKRADKANRGLSRLLRNCRMSRNKRVVLTSREYILTEAREKYDRLAHYDLESAKCVLNLADYTRVIRAEILYNHVYFSGLDDEQRLAFSEPAVYEPIIRHENYSPRLLEHALLQAEKAGLQNDPVTAVMENLDNPRRLWKLLVEGVLAEDELNLILAMYSLGRHVKHMELESAWRSLTGLNASVDEGRRFRHALKKLEQTMIRRAVEGTEEFVLFHNASIRDYLRSYVIENPDLLCVMLTSATYFEQVKNLWETTIQPTVSTGIDAYFESLADALLRLADPGDVSVRSGSAADWVRCVLQIAEISHGDRLEDLGCELLEDLNWNSYDSSGYELVDIARLLAQSRVQSWRSYLQPLAQRAASLRIREIFSWEEAWYASAIIDELSEIVDVDCGHELEDRKIELANAILNQWIDGEVPGHVDENELEEVLDYVSSNFSEAHPGCEHAENYLNTPRDNSEKKSNATMKCVDVERDNASIATIFGSLRDAAER